MPGFFDMTDPQSALPLLGLLQGLGQASMPSRTPVPFGAVLGQAAGGYLGGKQAAQDMQGNELRNKFLGLQTQQLQKALEQEEEVKKALANLRFRGQAGASSPDTKVGSVANIPTLAEQLSSEQSARAQPQNGPQLLTTDQITQKFGQPQQPPASDTGLALPAGFDSPEEFLTYSKINPSEALKRLFEKPKYGQKGEGINPATSKKEAYVLDDYGNPKFTGVQSGPDIGVTDGYVYDKNAIAPGTMIPQRPNPNQPFNPDGSPNTPYQDYQTHLRETGSRSPFQRTNLLLDANGRSLGMGRFNTQTGDLEIQDQAGAWSSAPPGARPAPIGTGGAMTPKQFQDLKIETMTDVQGLDRLQKYADTVGGANVGIKRWADAISQKAKTLVGSGQLTPEELNRAVANNQLQGLLGLFRVDVVGPGVMTETDAQRVLQALGGDVNAFQNPAVVEQALRQMYKYKYERVQLNHGEIERNSPFFNQVAPPLTIPAELQMGAPASSSAPPRQTPAAPTQSNVPRHTNLPQVDLSPRNLSAAALKSGKTVEQLKQELRQKGYRVP